MSAFKEKSRFVHVEIWGPRECGEEGDMLPVNGSHRPIPQVWVRCDNGLTQRSVLREGSLLVRVVECRQSLKT